MHLMLGILRTSQAVFYALAFFWLDGFAKSMQRGRSMQTVGWLPSTSHEFSNNYQQEPC
jgi:hypothetical protein